MSYQIITKMIYNAHTHQIETWQHSNNVWPRIDHFLAFMGKSWPEYCAIRCKYKELAWSKCGEIAARFRQLVKMEIKGK